MTNPKELNFDELVVNTERAVRVQTGLNRLVAPDIVIAIEKELEVAELLSPVELARLLELANEKRVSSRTLGWLSSLAERQALAASAIFDTTEAQQYGSISEVADVSRFWRYREERPSVRDGDDSRMPIGNAEEIFRELLAESE
jgi:hypothetical protein